ncbi:hypothetical protein FG386_002001 [Cryptosporidium ryanae]|uniref:uncharacterized protein n=1 Tax=Cryptosporidium ryanae TaxID=515981 RepID=UPI00351A5536|nr:hypothetical protein FG386_002001 [Cryptosporidium ryanae]
MNIKNELEKEEIRDVSEILQKGTDNCAFSEKRGLNLTKEIQMCQNKMLDLESKYNLKREEGQGEKFHNEGKYPHRVVIMSCMYTLLGELSSSVQSKVARELDVKYRRKNKFTTGLSGIGANKSYKDGNPNPSHSGVHPRMHDDSGLDSHLTPEMEKMAQELLNHFTSDIDALRESQNQLHEISNLMGFFSSKIQEQSEICTSIFSSARDAVDNIDASKTHLDTFEKANKQTRYVLHTIQSAHITSNCKLRSLLLHHPPGNPEFGRPLSLQTGLAETTAVSRRTSFISI